MEPWQRIEWHAAKDVKIVSYAEYDAKQAPLKLNDDKVLSEFDLIGQKAKEDWVPTQRFREKLHAIQARLPDVDSSAGQRKILDQNLPIFFKNAFPERKPVKDKVDDRKSAVLKREDYLKFYSV